MKQVLCIALLGAGVMSMAYANTVTIHNASEKPMGVQYNVLCDHVVCGKGEQDPITPGTNAPPIILKAPQTGVQLTELSSPFLPAKYQPWFRLPTDRCQLNQTGFIRIEADAHHIACSAK